MPDRLILTQKINKNKEVIPIDYIERREGGFYFITRGKEKQISASNLKRILTMYS